MVHFLLRLAVDGERNRRRELVFRSAVERDELLAVELERDRHDGARLARRFVALAADAVDLRVLEHRHVEVRRVFSLAVEPQERRDLFCVAGHVTAA